MLLPIDFGNPSAFLIARQLSYNLVHNSRGNSSNKNPMSVPIIAYVNVMSVGKLLGPSNLESPSFGVAY